MQAKQCSRAERYCGGLQRRELWLLNRVMVMHKELAS